MSNKDNSEEQLSINKETLILELGEKLKAARIQQKRSHQDVVDDLKFNLSFLEALETGNWSDMPGEIYALGFLRQYANLLGIDVETDIQSIKSNQYELTKPLTYPDSPISPNRTWVVAAILLFILINIMVNIFENETTEDATTAVLKTNQEEKVAPITPLAISSYTAVNHTNKQVEAKQQPNTTTPLQENKNISKTYGFFAVSDDVWLQVYQQQQNKEPQLLREALLKVGESIAIESVSPVLFTAGKPLALEVSLDGKIVFAQGSLGKNGKVLKLFPIKP